MNPLYQSLILDHNKNPYHFTLIPMQNADLYQEGFNPICGDHFHFYINYNDDKSKVASIFFQGSGCALSKASASMMGQLMEKRETTEILKFIEEFHHFITNRQDTQSTSYKQQLEKLGKLEVFSQVWNYPARIKCVSLPWHSLKAALNHSSDKLTSTQE